eukprot:2683351-Amphidinium_carterae.2
MGIGLHCHSRSRSTQAPMPRQRRRGRKHSSKQFGQRCVGHRRPHQAEGIRLRKALHISGPGEERLPSRGTHQLLRVSLAESHPRRVDRKRRAMDRRSEHVERVIRYTPLQVCTNQLGTVRPPIVRRRVSAVLIRPPQV